MPENFNGAAEPMRAIRDLICACEMLLHFSNEDHDQDILDRARDGFTALRKLFGDERLAEDIADAAMIEPRDLRTALQICAGALQSAAKATPNGMLRVVSFTGAWTRFGKMSVADVLDRANDALEIGASA